MRSPHRPAWPFWLLLTLPSLWLAFAAVQPGADLDELTAISGEWAAWLLAGALVVTPLLRLLPRLRPLVRHRRAIGLAAFGTTIVHLLLYLTVMGTLDDVLAEITAPGIWTGWAALALMLLPALTSRDAAMRALGRNWKRLQRLAWLAGLFTLAHVWLVHNGLDDALLLGLPVLLLQLLRFVPLPTHRKA